MGTGQLQRQLRTVQQQSEDYEARQVETAYRELVYFDDLGILPLAQLQDKPTPRREWMVEDCFIKGTVALISGDGGIGKSLLMQQLATCAVMGRSWLGKTVAAGKALLFACEDDHDELWRRQDAINRSLDVSMLDLAEGGLQLWPRVGQDNSLMYLNRGDPTGWKMAPTEMLERVARRCRRDGIQYLIIDTATQTFRGNQNDEIQVMDYITELRKLAIRIQGVVILTKHPSMSGRANGTGESGNVAWNNSVRSRLYLRKDKAGQLLLQTMKSNYGPSGNKIALKWQRGVLALDEFELPSMGYGYD